MIEIDQELFMDLASKVSRLKMYPYFDIAHYAMMVIAVRDDLATGATLFSRKHPLSCWLSSMMMCFAGSFMMHLLMGEAVIAPFKHHDDIILATLVWYLIFYSPFDLAYKAAKFLPFKIVLSVLKEVQRAHKVHSGVSHAMKIYPNAYLILVMIGTVKGAGSGIIRTFEQLVRGVWVPMNNEILRPTFYTKACIAASIIFVLEKRSGYISAPHELVYFGVVGFFVYFKLSSLLLGIHDPFMPFENLFCALCMGGIWDALSRAIAASHERRAAAAQNQQQPAVGEQPPQNNVGAKEAKKDL